MITRQRRRGIAFLLDALLAAFLVAGGFVVVSQMQQSTISDAAIQYERLHYDAEDALELFSIKTFDELNQTQKDDLLENTDVDVEDANKSLIDIVTLLWATDDISRAGTIAKDFFNETLPEDVHYRVSVQETDGTTTVLLDASATKPKSADYSYKTLAARIISGFKYGREIDGYVSRAIATEITTNDTEIYDINPEGSWHVASAGISITKRFHIPAKTTADIINGKIYLSVHAGSPADSDNEFRINGNGWHKFSDLDGLVDVESDNTHMIFGSEDIRDELIAGWNKLEIKFKSNQFHSHTHPGSRIEVDFAGNGTVKNGKTKNETHYFDNVFSKSQGNFKSGVWAIMPVYVPKGSTVHNATLFLNFTGVTNDASKDDDIHIYFNGEKIYQNGTPATNQFIILNLTGNISSNIGATNVVSAFANVRFGDESFPSPSCGSSFDDPGFAYEDRNNDRIYTPGTDRSISDADIEDGTYEVSNSDYGLVIPASLGSLVLNGNAKYSAGSSNGHLLIGTNITANGKIELKAGTDVQVTNTTLDANNGLVSIKDFTRDYMGCKAKIEAKDEITVQAPTDSIYIENATFNSTNKFIELKVDSAQIQLVNSTLKAKEKISVDTKQADVTGTKMTSDTKDILLKSTEAGLEAADAEFLATTNGQNIKLEAKGNINIRRSTFASGNDIILQADTTSNVLFVDGAEFDDDDDRATATPSCVLIDGSPAFGSVDNSCPGGGSGQTGESQGEFWGASDLTLFSDPQNSPLKSSRLELNYTEQTDKTSYGHIEVTRIEQFEGVAENPMTYSTNFTETNANDVFIHLVEIGSRDLSAKVSHNNNPESEFFRTPRILATPTRIGIKTEHLNFSTTNTFNFSDKCRVCNISGNTSLEYTLLVPSQVGYGSTFDALQESEEDAQRRLNEILEPYADILATETYSKDSVSSAPIPYLYGPVTVILEVWR